MKRQVELDVKGMSCGGCAGSVRSIIRKHLGLDEDSVAVDFEAGSARFSTDAEGKSLGEVCDELTQQGFESSVVTGG